MRPRSSVLPSWESKPLGEIADVRLGKMLDKAKHRGGQRFRYLRNINVRWGSIRTDDLFEMHFEDDELERYGLRPGDVLVCEGGEPGRAAVWDGRLPDLKYQKALHRVRFLRPYDPRLLVYFLEWLASSGGLERRFTGSTIKHFTRESFTQLSVPLPPTEIQARLVAEIEKQFTRLDAGVAALRRAQANLKRYRASVLKAACEGRLVPTEASLARAEGRPYESGADLLTRILTDRRHRWSGRGKYREPAEPEAATEGVLPDGWTMASPEQLSATEPHSLAIGPFGSNLKVSDYRDNGVPLVFVRNIRARSFGGSSAVFVSCEKAKELQPHQVASGDVLVTKMGDPPGDACLYPHGFPAAIITADCIKLRLSKRIEPRFVVNAINSEPVRSKILRITKGVAQLKVSLGRFSCIGIPLPPLGEQRRIVAEVDRRLSVLDELEALVSTNLQRATRLRQSILQRAFSGDLVRDGHAQPSSTRLLR